MMNEKQVEAALRQALETFERMGHKDSVFAGEFNGEITAIREALAEQQEQEQETVMAEYKFQTYAAYKTEGEMKIGLVPDDAPLTLNGVPLYPRREWQGLTDEEKSDLWCESTGRDCVNEDTHVFADSIEAKLREKNNG